MRMIIIITLMMCFLFYPVSAELTRLEIPLFVDFVGDSEFNLNWDGGMRNFRWDNSTQLEDVNFTMIIYRELNTSSICSGQINQYENLTNKMVDMLDVCHKLADNNNISIAMELSDAKFSLGLQSEKLNHSKIKITELEGKANQFDSCDIDRRNLRTMLSNCSVSLQNTSKGGKGWIVVVGILSFGLGYMIWGRKKESLPEYKEEGFEAY